MLIPQVLPLVTVGQSRVWHGHGITLLAIAPVMMVTHPSSNWAPDCLTSVINHEMHTPSY